MLLGAFWSSEVLALLEGDEALVERIWRDIDGLGNTFIWQLLLSF